MRSINKLFLFIIWLTLTFLSGFRILGFDRDYYNYDFFYESLPNILTLSDYRFEPGFTFFAWFCKNFLGLNFFWFITFAAGISLSIKLYLFSKRPYFIYTIITYIFTLYLLHEMTQIRVSLAIAFGFLGLEMHLRGKRYTSIVLLILAFSMQYSILVLAPFFIIPLNWIDNERRYLYLLILLIASNLIFFSSSMHLLESINPYIPAYIAAEGDKLPNLLSVRSLSLFLISFIGLIYYKNSDISSRIFIMIGILGWFLFVFMMMTPAFSQRFFELLSFSYFLWITKVRSTRLITCSIFILASIYIGYAQIYTEELFSLP